MKKQLSVVILTYNESIHIERAIKNVLGWADHIVVLDSYSQDDTVEKAKLLDAEVILRKFDNYKNQREYAINHVKDKSEWMFFLDADEYLSEELKKEVKEAIKDKLSAGYYLARRFIFMNQWIKWGGYYPTYLLRLFRPELASLERTINEHVSVDGEKKKLKHDLIDENLKNIGFWIEKHNRYAYYEAKELFEFKVKNENDVKLNFWSSQSERKQWLRYKIWNKLPVVIIRPFAYFIYRYVIRLGFLDGKKGFVFHFLQAFWFWLIVDIKYDEMRKKNNPL